MGAALIGHHLKKNEQEVANNLLSISLRKALCYFNGTCTCMCTLNPKVAAAAI